MQRVAITGVGLVTPLGLTAADNVARSRLGESGIGPARAFAVDGHAAQALASVAGFELESLLRFPKNYKFMSRAVQFAMHCGPRKPSTRAESIRARWTLRASASKLAPARPASSTTTFSLP